MKAHEAREEREPVRLGHGDIERQRIRVQGVNLAPGEVEVRRRPDHFNRRISSELPAEELALEGGAIDDQYPDTSGRHGRCHGSRDILTPHAASS